MGSIRLVRKSLEGRHLGKRPGLVSRSDLREAGEVGCGLMGKANFSPVLRFFSTHVLGKLGRCCGQRSRFVLVSEQQIISSRTVTVSQYPDCFAAFHYFGMFVFQVLHGLLQQMKSLIQTPL